MRKLQQAVADVRFVALPDALKALCHESQGALNDMMLNYKKAIDNNGAEVESIPMKDAKALLNAAKSREITVQAMYKALESLKT